MTTENTEFCEYVKFILQRMETNPEDFLPDPASGLKIKGAKYPRFRNIGAELWEFGKNGNSNALWVFTKEERIAMRDAYSKMRKDHMMKEALLSIMDPSKEVSTIQGGIDMGLYAPLTPHPSMTTGALNVAAMNSIITQNANAHAVFTGSGDAGYSSTNATNKTP